MTGSSAATAPIVALVRHLAELRSLGWAMTETDDGIVITPPQAA